MKGKAFLITLALILVVMPIVLAVDQTEVFNCDFDTDSCGFDLSASNNVLNVTSSTSLDWSASDYTWSNHTMMVYAPTSALGFKHSVTNGDHRWFIDGACWKIEPDYSTQRCSYTLDAWVEVSIITNHSSNTSEICFGGGCTSTSAGVFTVDPAEDSLQFATTYSGGDIAYDNMTINVLTSEAPAGGGSGCSYGGSGAWAINGSNCTTIGSTNDMLGNAVSVTEAAITLNSSASITNFSSFTAYVTVTNQGGTLG